jgi:hypothetical protein
VELAKCRRHPLHWITHHCFTYDPRRPLARLPFDPFPKQVEFLSWLAERERQGEPGLVEKSRDVGATWLCCLYAIHGWLFRKGFAAGFGSRKLDLVDRLGDPDCIFEKLRYLLANIPEWIRPGDYLDGHCKLVNHANGSSITGEGGDQIGRGGRKSIYFVDEAAFLEHPDMIERSLSQTTDCRIDISTPNGPGNPFAQKRFSGKVSVFILDWHDDPRKSQEWYEKQKATKDPVTIASELDRDYTASIEGITIPAAWVRAAVGLSLPASGPVVAGLDIAELGRAKSAFVPRQGPVVRLPIVWGQCNTSETAYRAADEARHSGAQVVCYDVSGVGAGVRGVWDTCGGLPFDARAINTGEAPTDTRWPDGRTSKELFVNLRAELWWLVRLRFERTYEHVVEGKPHPLDELICIPNDPELIAELSLPLYHRTDRGKIQIESKDDMRRRGVKSPDRADALCLAWHPVTLLPAWEPQPRAARSLMSRAPRDLFVCDRDRDDDEPEGPIDWSQAFG